MNRLACIALLWTVFSAMTFGQTPGGGAASASPPAKPDMPTIKQKYRTVEIDRFELREGLDIPAEYPDKLLKEIATSMTNAKLFEQVLSAGQQAAADAPLLRLTGKIHNYKKGSRTARYLGAGLAGTAEIDAQVVLIDATTGQKLARKEVRGVLYGGVFGGAEDQATKELARQIVSEAKLIVERRVPAAELSEQPQVGGAGPMDTQVFTIRSEDLDGSEKELNQKAAKGYRVTDCSLTGKNTEELQLEKGDSSGGAYEYRLLHMRVFTHLQGDINKAVGGGFSVVPGTLNTLGPYLTVVMQKTGDSAPYSYHVSVSVLQSNAEKDAAKFQKDGYTLLDAAQAPALHVLLFQKPAGN